MTREDKGRFILWEQALVECRFILDRASIVRKAFSENQGGLIRKGELLTIDSYLKMLAVVIYFQIFSNGNADTGVAARNSKEFMNDHLGNIKALAFQEHEWKCFEDFTRKCKHIRDKVLGHADAKEFSITYGEDFTRSKLHSASIQELDFEYMYHLISRLDRALSDYTAKLNA